MELRFTTDLNCGSCVAKVKPHLDQVPGIENWSVDTKQTTKPLTVMGKNIDAGLVKQAVEKGGFHVLDAISAPTEVNTETYRPLILIFFYLVGSVLLLQARNSSFDPHLAMTQFMGGFFLVFSFFKFLNLSKFADAYSTYDVIAKRSRGYALAYPFIELILGMLYLAEVSPIAVNAFTLVIMSVSTIGVVQAVFNKRSIECACLGTVFNLPMTKVTIFENGLMIIMAIVMLSKIA